MTHTTPPAPPTAGATDLLDLLELVGATLAAHPQGHRIKLQLGTANPGDVLVERVGADGAIELDRHTRTGRATTGTAGTRHTAADLAAAVTSTLWTQLLRAGGLGPQTPVPVHLPGLFVPAWLQGLPLPRGQRRLDEQRVALIDGSEFERVTGETAIANAYRDRPRTRLLESIHLGDDWISLMALLLTRLAQCEVVCSLYESQAGDAGHGEHRDEFVVAAIQILGRKHWQVRVGPGTEPLIVVTEPGDVLLVPRDIPHAVWTPQHSVHLTVGFLTHVPIPVNATS